MTTTNDLNRDTVDLLTRFGAFVWRNNTGAVKRGDRYIRFGLVGSGDVIGLWADGRFVSVETKTGRDKASPEQIEFARKVNALGGMAIFARDIDDVIEMIGNLKTSGDMIPF